jgi:hypothetical protein
VAQPEMNSTEQSLSDWLRFILKIKIQEKAIMLTRLENEAETSQTKKLCTVKFDEIVLREKKIILILVFMQKSIAEAHEKRNKDTDNFLVTNP